MQNHLTKATQHLLDGLKFPDSKDHARVYVCSENALSELRLHGEIMIPVLKSSKENFDAIAQICTKSSMTDQEKIHDINIILKNAGYLP